MGAVYLSRIFITTGQWQDMKQHEKDLERVYNLDFFL
jgi:hypothetical protein